MYNFIIINSINDKSIELVNRLVILRAYGESGSVTEVAVALKVKQDLCGDENILYLDPLDINSLVVILLYGFATGSHWQKLSKGLLGFVCIVS